MRRTTRTDGDFTWNVFYRRTANHRETFRTGYPTSARGPDLDPERFAFAEAGCEYLTAHSTLQMRAYAGEDGADRIRSPHHRFMANGTCQPTKRLGINVLARTTSGYRTSESTTTPTLPVDGHAIVDLALRLKTGATNDTELFLNIGNVTDRRIVEIYPFVGIPPEPGWVAHRQAVLGYSIRF